ncbi:hypothetical protein EXIGLDRAFT_427671 [Exidia glandulosa HHB12029]|uniref:Uncharacterized protein n=1 Tax=Exidia glandulosa HHB12029 TaxID=1314781 RepID=A0A165KIE3_EXIGL|nr:hypothetical protein EXIGLDRAFT_427671 [Exidia glandulosa HHB12029]
MTPLSSARFPCSIGPYQLLIQQVHRLRRALVLSLDPDPDVSCSDVHHPFTFPTPSTRPCPSYSWPAVLVIPRDDHIYSCAAAANLHCILSPEFQSRWTALSMYSSIVRGEQVKVSFVIGINQTNHSSNVAAAAATP